MLTSETEKAYKRGVVLGLTLAELLILFVFCLLLLFAAWIGRTLEGQRAEAKTPTQAEQTWEMIRRELNELRGVKPIEPFWRELVASHHEVTRDRQKPAEPTTDEGLKAQIFRDMEEMRGAKKLDDYWRNLKQARQEADLKSAVNEKLVKELQELKKKLAEAVALLERAKSDLAKAERTIGRTQEDARQANEEAKKAREAESRFRSEIAGLRRDEAARKGHDWPPIISLKEADGYFFISGDARLSKAFEEKLRTEVIDKILEYTKTFEVDVIEVVGHTDDMPIFGRASNLDAMLMSFLRNEKGHAPLSAADNAGLGMARAAAVARFLMSDSRINGSGRKILPLSSAQALDKDGFLARSGAPRNTPERRRIEIRLRRSSG